MLFRLSVTESLAGSQIEGKGISAFSTGAWRLTPVASDPAFFVVQMPHARDEGSVALVLRPIDRPALRFESGEHAVGMVFNDIIGDSTVLRAPLRPRFHKHVCHLVLLPRNYAASDRA
jgi:hypothetical protein